MQVRSASFSPDGTRIVTASDDGTVRVWHGTLWRERKVELDRYHEAMMLVTPHIDEMFARSIEPTLIVEQVRNDQSLTRMQRRASLNLILKGGSDMREAERASPDEN